MKKSNKRKKTCRCKTIKGIGKAHTFNCVFGKRKKTVKGFAIIDDDGLHMAVPLNVDAPFPYAVYRSKEDAVKSGGKFTACTISFELPKK